MEENLPQRSTPSGGGAWNSLAGVALWPCFEPVFSQPPATQWPKTLNAGFRPTHPLDYEPESGRVDLRCHSAKALLAYPQLRSISRHQGKVLKKLSKRAQHLPPSGVLTNRGQDVAHLVQTRGSYLNGTIKVKGSESSCDD